MKVVKITVLIFSAFLVILLLTSLSIASTSLSHYEATFEVIANQKNEFSDIQVELKIIYHIDNELKTSGMKLVEAQSIEAIQVTDGEGKPLRFEVSRSGKRNSKISWYFPGVSEGKQGVIVNFKLPDALPVEGGKSCFRAYWVGSWIMPVDKALYRFIFPAGYSYKVCSVYPQYEYKEKEVEGKKQIEISMAPLKGESFALAFSPSFTEWQGTRESGKKSDKDDKTFSHPEKGGENIIERVRFGVHDAFSRITFDLRREATYRVIAVPQGNLITLSVPNCTLSSQAKGEEYNDTLVRALELKEKSGKEVVAKIELTELKSSFTHHTLSDPPRIIFNIMPRKDVAKSERESSKRLDKEGEKHDIEEERVSQFVPSSPEEKIKEEEIKEPERKEDKVKGEDKVLSAS
ncbi:MAG: hypothetical protein AMJ42_02435, partial [Deltaproteobacteria bacterium DG_8]